MAQEAVQQFEQTAANVAGMRSEAINATKPPAVEPIDPSRVKMLHEALQTFADVIGENQVVVPPLEIPEGELTEVPPGVYDGVAAVAAYLDAQTDPVFEPYKFDIGEMATSNDGILEMSNLMIQMSQDKDAVRAALQGGAPQEVPEEVPEETTEPEENLEGLL